MRSDFSSNSNDDTQLVFGGRRRCVDSRQGGERSLLLEGFQPDTTLLIHAFFLDVASIPT